MSRGQVHNAISRGQLSSALTRAVGDLEGDSGLERYGETLTPVLDLFRLPEWAYLRRERICAATAQASAVAGEQGIFSLLNPVGSGMLIVVDSIRPAMPATTVINLAFPMDATAVIGTIVSSRNSRDSRWGAVSRPIGELYQGTTAAPPGSTALIQQSIHLINETQEALAGQPLVISPGVCVQVVSTTANQAARINFCWRERKAFPGELE